MVNGSGCDGLGALEWNRQVVSQRLACLEKVPRYCWLGGRNEPGAIATSTSYSYDGVPLDDVMVRHVNRG